MFDLQANMQINFPCYKLATLFFKTPKKVAANMQWWF